ncbi:hypothetical protein FGG08_006434 [Glutinoglossum americanum]|uniref:Uncharacterized protein n=1 Tax=Glutinoglossum americanum TaxID=1670608 RepID=A0A9P8I1A8_9PEZI|nr:hypothetical protein FGG08_006434 [Glutinoglossum americanum]
MSESKLDQIVKGAPSLNATLLPAVKLSSPSNIGSSPVHSHTHSHVTVTPPPLLPSDPLSTLPSSPPQIYLNLLILEASFRSQYLTLRDRRRQHTFFLFLLSLWIGYCVYFVFLRPREDGQIGGSVYWVVDMGHKVALMGGVVTGILLWGTGQLERGIRWPRRWVGVANRGLRSINSKVVIIKGPWWKEMFSTLSFLFPYSSLFPSMASSYVPVESSYPPRSLKKRPSMSSGLNDHLRPHRRNISRTPLDDDDIILPEEDLAPGGDYIKLLLLPKPFSPDFRENWELYRSEYWEKENERRARLRQNLRQQQIEIAKQEGGWLWWTGWRGWKRTKAKGIKGMDIEKLHPQRHHNRDLKHRQPGSTGSISHSRTSSRSSTPTPDLEELPTSERTRRSSTASSNERRKKNKSTSSAGSTRIARLTAANSRASTPSPLDNLPVSARSSSRKSFSSGNESERSLNSLSD